MGRLIPVLAAVAAVAILYAPPAAHAQTLLERGAASSPCAGVAIETDFQRGLYCENGQRFSGFLSMPGASFSRSTAETCSWQSGLLSYAAANQPCITDAGLQGWQQSTNLVLQSQAIGTLPWGANGSPTITQKAGLAPDGTLTASSVQASTQGYGPIQGNITLTAGQVYTISVFVRNNGGLSTVSIPRLNQNWFGGSGGDRTATFDMASGQLSSVNAVFTSTSVTQLSNGWWRVALTFSPTTTASAPIGFYSLGSGSWNFFLWGAQLEAQSFVTPYIPTTTASATRGANLAGITYSQPLLNGPFTMLVKGDIYNTSGTSAVGLVTVDDGTSNNEFYMSLNLGNTALHQQLVVAGTTVFNTSGATGLPLTNLRMAVSWAGSGLSYGGQNGAAGPNSTANFQGFSDTNLKIGRLVSGQPIDGFIRSVTVTRSFTGAASLPQLTQ